MSSPKKITRVLGIDPGTRMTGYAAIEVAASGEFTYIECGTLKVDGRRELNARLSELGSAVQELLDELKPDVLAIESAFHGQNAASALKLAEARGAFKILALHAGLEIAEYAPARIKRVVVGQGRATKGDVQRRVRLLCGLAKVPQSDAADALAVAICHAQTMRAPKSRRP